MSKNINKHQNHFIMKTKKIYLSELNYDALFNFVSATFDNIDEDSFMCYYENANYPLDVNKSTMNNIIEVLTSIVRDFKVERKPNYSKFDYPDDVIKVGVYYYTDDDGEKVFDTDEMIREFEYKLKQYE